VKVLVVGTGGALRGSGITTMTEQLERSLVGLGYEVERVVAGGSRRRRPNRVNLENLHAILEDVRLVRRAALRTRADVVWIHTIGVPTLPALRALALTVAARSSRRVVVQFHAFDLAARIRTSGRAQRSILGFLARLATTLVVLHEADCTALCDVVGPDKVVVLPNWVDVPDVPTPSPSSPPFRLVYVGGLVRRKGLPELLQAMRKVSDRPIVLRVVGGPGDDGEAAAEEIVRSAHDLVAEGAVAFVGLLEPCQVRDELRRAHLFVLPSRAEGMPLALLEALAEGRAALVSDTGNMAEVVRRHGSGAVLTVVDPDEIARMLRQLADRPVDVEAMGRSAHAGVLAEYSTSAVTGAVVRILKSTTAKCSGR
jgi:glycosyltransferase involved in cell wall biosynthesis